MPNIEIHRSREKATGHMTSTGCACGEAADDLPVLDVAAIPHAVRHGAVFGALDALRPGAGLVILAPHDPIPLLSQLEERHGSDYVATYIGDRGPEHWRILVRRAA